MRIAILGSVALPVPPKAQGGIEWIVYHQTEGLVKRGHQVLLFAPQGSKTSAKLITVSKGDIFSYHFNPGRMESSRKLRLEMSYLTNVLEQLLTRRDAFDIILNNMRGGESLFLPFARFIKKPLVSVLHLPIFQELADIFRQFNAPLITISNNQRKKFPNLNYIATVYNGVYTKDFTFEKKSGDYLLMIGSIGRHKNQGAAIRVAKKLGIKLILAGKIRDQDYFDELKADIDGGRIQWVGEVGFTEKVKLYQKAQAFLFPILWEEPFGLVMIEAMACGTPVIAFNRGAVPEVVVDGKTGFIVENVEEMVEATKKIDQIDRAVCRKHVEQNFTIERMVDEYEKLYQQVLGL